MLSVRISNSNGQQILSASFPDGCWECEIYRWGELVFPHREFAHRKGISYLFEMPKDGLLRVEVDDEGTIYEQVYEFPFSFWRIADQDQPDSLTPVLLWKEADFDEWGYVFGLDAEYQTMPRKV